MPTLALLALLALAPVAAQAQLYKWVDEQGRTHYSEKPPAAAQKSQTIRTDPAPKPPVATPAAAAKGASKAAASSSGESERLQGSWASASSASVSVRFSVTDRGDSAISVGQQWTIGGRSQVNTPSRYTVAGTGGAGTLTARDPASQYAPDVPTSIGYRLEGNVLRLSVPSGLYAGEHVLTR